jgi:hypothetical protein
MPWTLTRIDADLFYDTSGDASAFTLSDLIRVHPCESVAKCLRSLTRIQADNGYDNGGYIHILFVFIVVHPRKPVLE